MLVESQSYHSRPANFLVFQFSILPLPVLVCEIHVERLDDVYTVCMGEEERNVPL